MDQLEQQFHHVLGEWTTLHQLSRSDIGRWEQSVADIAADEARLRDAGRWLHGRADFLGVMGCHRDELVHSRMIGWLLDPCGHHGLGSQVLTKVLAHTGMLIDGTVRPERARVRLEVPIAQGRMDIVVEGPGFYLVIENKVDASEGPDQCAYYAANVERQNARFVFLTPDGRPAQNASMFKPMRYSVLADTLEGVLAGTSDMGFGRDIVAEYLRTLRLEFQ